MVEGALRRNKKITSPDRGLSIHVRGIVQGVGFRPFVFKLAERYHLAGWVKNTSAGVDIEIDGDPLDLEDFLISFTSELPPLARLDQINVTRREANGYTQFEILTSDSRVGEFIPISPDIAICPGCRRELFDPADRRYRYPFINCTNCGPRFSIIRDIPYDRPFTTMAGFTMCPECDREYHDPRDRRFHAQPTACPVCGPQIWLYEAGVRIANGENAFAGARNSLSGGKILAIKGLGGFHLACDASNPDAVNALRNRKKRSDKPFALMVQNLALAEKYFQVEADDRKLLESCQSPIVLLKAKGKNMIAPGVAPGQRFMGVMLAYTPLHLLLLEPAQGFPEILVMTSGNISEEPIAFRDDEAIQRLAPLADEFLLHDRPIHIRVDDSVTTSVRKQRYVIRRARGEAPDPIQLPFDLPPLLAVGAELKNTFCLTRERYAFLSHHIGDLQNFETLRSYQEGIQHYEKLFRVNPEMIASDLHPNYLSSRYAQERAANSKLPVVNVQHHHAHLAACLADNAWTSSEPVIGLCFDGTGLGTDDAIWGGEVLIGGYSNYKRAFHLAYTPLPGGDLAVRKPARMALSHLITAGIDLDPEIPAVEFLCADERTAIRSQMMHRLNAPLTSSIGRLFDAVSSLIGLRHTATYEGQAAIELETAAAAEPGEMKFYPFDIGLSTFDPKPILDGLLNDWRAGLSTPVLSARFHNSIAHLCLELSEFIRRRDGITHVALSGGVWQNRFLLERTLDILETNGFFPLTHRQVPANDGGISLGQAAIAAHVYKGR